MGLEFRLAFSRKIQLTKQQLFKIGAKLRPQKSYRLNIVDMFAVRDVFTLKI